MSTRSVIAVPHGDAWRGHYCHSDGYPTWNGRELFAIVTRDGLEKARWELTEEHYGWSSIVHEEMGRSKEYLSGYGRYYTDQPADEWYTPGDTGDTEWVYVLADNGLWVLTVAWGPNMKDNTESLVRVVPWGAEDIDWQEIEEAGNAGRRSWECS